MESALLWLCVAAGIICTIRSKPVLLGISCGILLLLKVDTAFWVCSVLAVVLFARREWIPKVILPALVLFLPWGLYSFAAFGSPATHTLEAKFVAYINPSSIDPVDLVRILTPQGFSENPIALLFYGCFLFSTVSFSAWAMWRRKAIDFFPVLLYTISYWLMMFYVKEKMGILWTWWTVPLTGCVFILGGLVIDDLIDVHLSDSGRDWLRRRFLALSGALAILLIAVWFTYISARYAEPRANLETAAWLREHCKRSDSVMLETIGFATEMYVYDFVGLVSPEVTKAGEITDTRIVGSQAS